MTAAERVLVTGAAGFLGRALVSALLDRGESVVAFDLDAAGVLPLTDLGATAVAGDLGRWNDVLAAVAAYGVRRVFHCGALLSAAAGDPVGDDAPQWPTTIYGATKVFAERLVEYYHHRYGLDVRALRFPSVVGHGRGPSGASAFTSLAFDEPACGRPYALYVSPDVRCQLLHVDDAVRALFELDAAPANALRRRVYNIGGLSPSAEELVDAVRRAIPGADLAFVPDPGLEAIVRSWPLHLDDSAAQADWGWKRELDLDAVAERFVAAARWEGRS